MRLNIGCGGQIVDGWVNLDVAPTVDGAMYGDLLLLQAQFDYVQSERFEIVVAHHVLDLLDSWADLITALSNCRYVVAADGIVRVSCSDPRRVLDAVDRGDDAFFHALGFDDHTGMGERVQRWLSWRRLLLTPELVGRAATRAGFTTALEQTFGYSTRQAACELDSRQVESFFVDLIP